MDPDEALRRIRENIARVNALWDKADEKGLSVSTGEITFILLDLSEHAEALDMWLSRGGFPPKAWRK